MTSSENQGEYKVRGSAMLHLAMLLRQLSGETEADDAPHGFNYYLEEIAERLLVIREMEIESEQKERMFSDIRIMLELCAEDVLIIMEGLDESTPDQIREICKELDRAFSASAEKYLESIKAMYDFTKTGERELIANSLDLIREGSLLLNRVDSMACEIAREYQIEEQTDVDKFMEEFERNPAESS